MRIDGTLYGGYGVLLEGIGHRVLFQFPGRLVDEIAALRIMLTA